MRGCDVKKIFNSLFNHVKTAGKLRVGAARCVFLHRGNGARAEKTSCFSCPELSEWLSLNKGDCAGMAETPASPSLHTWMLLHPSVSPRSVFVIRPTK